MRQGDRKERRAGIDAQLDTQVEVVKQAAVAGAQLGPVDDPAGKILGMIHARAGQVGEQHAKGNGQQQQGLELFDDGQVQQHAGNENHHQVQRLVGHNGKAGALQKGLYSFHSGSTPSYLL